MAARFALTWYRPAAWAKLLDKPEGKAVSPYLSHRYDDVRDVAAHINRLNPEMCCDVEVYSS